jgi:hypothetical protein
VRDKGSADWIMYHVDGARRQGAEAADLVVDLEAADETGGGPTLMYAGKALEAFHSM